VPHIGEQDPRSRGSNWFGMPQQISRRNLVKRAAGAAAGLAAPAVVGAWQQPPSEQEAKLEAELAVVEAQLARPLSPQAKALTRQAIAANRAAATQRLRFALPENSEPCARFEAVRPTDFRWIATRPSGGAGSRERQR
jgi:hypothetical protein